MGILADKPPCPHAKPILVVDRAVFDRDRDCHVARRQSVNDCTAVEASDPLVSLTTRALNVMDLFP
jgi:hypothetical protein